MSLHSNSLKRGLVTSKETLRLKGEVKGEGLFSTSTPMMVTPGIYWIIGEF